MASDFRLDEIDALLIEPPGVGCAAFGHCQIRQADQRQSVLPRRGVRIHRKHRDSMLIRLARLGTAIEHLIELAKLRQSRPQRDITTLERLGFGNRGFQNRFGGGIAVLRNKLLAEVQVPLQRRGRAGRRVLGGNRLGTEDLRAEEQRRGRDEF